MTNNRHKIPEGLLKVLGVGYTSTALMLIDHFKSSPQTQIEIGVFFGLPIALFALYAYRKRIKQVILGGLPYFYITGGCVVGVQLISWIASYSMTDSILIVFLIAFANSIYFMVNKFDAILTALQEMPTMVQRAADEDSYTLKKIEGLLGPIALASLNETGWDSFLESHRKVYELTKSAMFKRKQILMRDERGQPSLAYSDEVEALRERGWTGPDFPD